MKYLNVVRLLTLSMVLGASAAGCGAIAGIVPVPTQEDAAQDAAADSATDSPAPFDAGQPDAPSGDDASSDASNDATTDGASGDADASVTPDGGRDGGGDSSVLQDSGPDAEDARAGDSGSDACTNVCSAGQTTCADGGTATCALGSNGCYAYGAPSACGANQACAVDGGAASCVCKPALGCSGSGTFCTADGGGVISCAEDGEGCFYASATGVCSGGACGGDAGSATCCVNGCVAGQTECTDAGVSSCTVQANGCTAWVQGATCGAHQTCQAPTDAGAATCACNATVCTKSGNSCANATTLETCATDVNGCLYVASTTTCASPQSCSGTTPDAGCALTCTSSCSSGQTACVTGGLATCTLGTNGCWSYGTATACGSHQTCTGPSGTAACTCNGVSGCSTSGNTCTGGSTFVTCAVDSNSCLYITDAGSCGPHQTCGGAGGAATCSCNSVSACTTAGNTCNSGSSYVTCAVDSNSCLYVADAGTCGSRQTCTGGTCECVNAAACSKAGTVCATLTQVDTCAADVNGCLYVADAATCGTHQTCNAGECVCTPVAACTTTGNACTTLTSYVTCTTDTNGCFVESAPVNCSSDKNCTGDAGDAGCSCIPVPACTAPGNVCTGGSSFASCSTDSNGCWVESAPSNCDAGSTCAGDAGAAVCCPYVCAAGATRCIADASTAYETCTTQSNGCVAWSAPLACSSGLVCEPVDNGCYDPIWAEWPMPNGALDVAEGAPHPESYTTETIGGVSIVIDEVTGLMWLESVPTGADGGAVLYSLAAAETYCSVTVNQTPALNGGYTDWRLPQGIELVSIVDYSPDAGPLINAQAFPSTPATTFWTSTTMYPVDGGIPGVATVDFSVGSYTTSANTGVTAAAVRCVR